MIAIALKGRFNRPRRFPAGGRSFPRALAGAWIGLAAVLGGAAMWVALSGEDAADRWRASTPRVSVPLAAGNGAPNEAAPAADPHAAPAAPAAGHGAAAPAAETPAHGAGAAAPHAPEGPSAADPNAAVALAPAPAPGMIEETKIGPLPRIAADGRRPWQVYARPFPAGIDQPKVAIVLTDLGISGVITGNAIERLPPAVTFAFFPLAERLDTWVDQARGAGHEVMLTVPMEPIDFPRNDPGPDALFTLLKPERNVERLEKWLTHGIGFIGITTSNGAKFMANARALQPVMDVLRSRGLMFVDPRLTPESAGFKQAQDQAVPVAAADRIIDRDLSRGAIDDQLKELESLAKTRGAAVGFGFPYPNTVERIAQWSIGLADRGVVLAPVSAVAVAPPPGAVPPPSAEAPKDNAGAHAAPSGGGHAAPAQKGH